MDGVSPLLLSLSEMMSFVVCNNEGDCDCDCALIITILFCRPLTSSKAAVGGVLALFPPLKN